MWKIIHPQTNTILAECQTKQQAELLKKGFACDTVIKDVKEKTESNPRGAGRPMVDVGRATMNISGTPAQLNKLRELAQLENKTVSKYILEKTGLISS